MHQHCCVLVSTYSLTKHDVFSMIWMMHSVCGPMLDVPEEHGRKVEDDTVILSNVQSGSSAVYQCNASNEFGYLLANAFVNVLGELKRNIIWVYSTGCCE